MKQEIINQLRAELPTDRFCQQDFNAYDIPELSNTSGPFLWAVTESSTHLLRLDIDFINESLDKESTRLALFRDSGYLLHHLGLSTELRKIFYYNGDTLTPATYSEAQTIYYNTINPNISRYKSKYPADSIVCHDYLDVRFINGAAERYEADTKYAEELDDASLTNCIGRLHRWTRRAVNHYIVITTDFLDHSYLFQEFINNKPGVNGGIIMHPTRENNHWSIHT